jgi:heme oxygenase
MNIVLKLREATQADHNNLDRIPLLNKLSEQSLSMSEYTELLQRFHHLHTLYEEAINEHKAKLIEYIPDLEERMKTSWLLNDLQEIGQKPKVYGFKLKQITCISELMGCFYVLEGSTLGRSRLRDPLIKSLPELTQLNNKFFTSYGNETGTKWKNFCNFLVDFTVSNDYNQISLIEGAKKTFMSVRELFLIDDR